jgi:hypothetical protein
VAATGKIALIEIDDMQGVESVKKSSLNPRYIFIAPPSMATLERRLRKRASENEEELNKQLRNLHDQMKYGEAKGNFDVKLVNNDLEYALLKLAATLRIWYPLLAPIPELTLEQKKSALTIFFAKHNSEKAKNVGKILQEFQFSDVVISLYDKYGGIPPGWGSRGMVFKTDEALLGKQDRTAIIEAGEVYICIFVCGEVYSVHLYMDIRYPRYVYSVLQ